jgi:hypothetical protein
LVVCQKRAALDVVYQRIEALGLSNHVAFVHDEKMTERTSMQKLAMFLIKIRFPMTAHSFKKGGDA